MVMLVTVLTLPSKAGEGNQAVCGRLRQFRAVDAKAAGGERNATSVQQLMKNNYDEKRVTSCLSGCRERKVVGTVSKNALSMSIAVGLNASDEDEWFHFQGHSLPSSGAFLRRKGYSATEVWGPGNGS
jgi:hypothetical protein